MPIDAWSKSLSENLEQDCHPELVSGSPKTEQIARWRSRIGVRDDSLVRGLRRGSKHLTLALGLIVCLAPAAPAQDLFLTNARIVDPAAQEVRQASARPGPSAGFPITSTCGP